MLRPPRSDSSTPLHLVLAAALTTLPACLPATAPSSPCSINGSAGLWDSRVFNPFPSQHLMTEDTSSATACQVSIPEGLLPVGDSAPLDTRRFNRLDGFSPVQSLWFQPNVQLEASTLPPITDLERSLSPASSVQIWNLNTGTQIRHFAELDASTTVSEDSRALLIRPQEHLGFGQRIAVVLTEDLGVTGGGTLSSPDQFDRWWAGEHETGEEATALHYQALRQELENLGVDGNRIVLAWDFMTATESVLRAPFDRVLATMREDLPIDGSAIVDFEATRNEDRLEGGTPADGLWREVRGSVQLPQYLWAEDGSNDPDSDHDGGLFQLDDAGLPILRDRTEVYFTLAIPDTLESSPARSLPLLVFGHGLFAAPADYIASPTDENGVVDICRRLGAVCIGSEWRGLTARDRPDILRVTGDLSRFPLVTDKLIQGVVNQMALGRLAHSSFVEAPFLAASDGSGSLIDPERIYYYGISLGGIEGATLLANSEIIDRGVLHVPGSVWSQLLERSSNWSPLEGFLLETLPDPASRQLIFSAIQLLFDPVDPIHHTDLITGHRSQRPTNKAGLWQVSVGDEQVMNFTADLFARTAGLPRITPSPYSGGTDLDELQAPTETQGPSSGLFHFDPQRSLPSEDNRPAEVTGAHDLIRTSEEAKSQTVTYLKENARIDHPCGEPCLIDEGN